MDSLSDHILSVMKQYDLTEESPLDVPVLKAQLRREMRAVRAAMSAEQRHEASANICERLLRLLSDMQLNHSSAIAVYLAKDEEASLDALIESLLERRCIVVAPVTGPEHTAPFYSLHDMKHGLARSSFGVREPLPYPGGAYYRPEKIRLMLVPGLAFDLRGGRLGYGGGWYDNVLLCASLTIGVCFDCQLIAAVPQEAHDQRVNGVLTESRTGGRLEGPGL